MSSSDHSPDIPRTSDGPPNWAADTDPAGPVTPELALVDPGLAPGGENESEVTMSSMQFGDGTTFSPAETAPAQPSLDPLQAAPLQPLQPLVAPSPPPAADPAPPAPPESTAAIPVSDMRDVPLGTLVFRAGLVPEERLEEALQEGMKTGKRLGEILLERGWVSETDLGRLLAAQKGLSFVELDVSTIDRSAPPLLHPEKARLHGALPIGFKDGAPVVAVADPSNDLVVENVRRALETEPVLVVAGRDALQRAINEVYGLSAPEQPAQHDAEEAPVAPPVEQQPTAPPVPVFPQTPPAEPLAGVDPVAAADPVPPPAREAALQPEPDQPVESANGVWLGEHSAAVSAPEHEPVQPVDAPLPAPVAPPAAPPAPTFEAPQPPPLATPHQVPVAEAPVAPTEPEPVAEPAPQPAETAQPEATWAVVLRLADGERVEVGSFAGEAEAVEGARAVVSQIAGDQGWPFFAGRFIRPEAIVSVDLVELQGWLGSHVRAGAFSAE